MPKVMVVITKDLLSEVDAAARASQMNRSAFIRRSLRAQVRSERRLRRLRRKILDDAKAMAKDFHKYWNPEDEAMWMTAHLPPDHP